MEIGIKQVGCGELCSTGTEHWLFFNRMPKVQGSESAAVYQMSNYQILNMNPGFYILINEAGNVHVT
jgi:hypothetical protein